MIQSLIFFQFFKAFEKLNNQKSLYFDSYNQSYCSKVKINNNELNEYFTKTKLELSIIKMKEFHLRFLISD